MKIIFALLFIILPSSVFAQSLVLDQKSSKVRVEVTTTSEKLWGNLSAFKGVMVCRTSKLTDCIAKGEWPIGNYEVSKPESPMILLIKAAELQFSGEVAKFDVTSFKKLEEANMYEAAGTLKVGQKSSKFKIPLTLQTDELSKKVLRIKYSIPLLGLPNGGMVDGLFNFFKK